MLKALLFTLVLLAQATPTWAASAAFQDAFLAHIKARELEELLVMAKVEPVIDELERQERLSNLSSKLTEARVNFHAVMRSDREKLNSWELATLSRMDRSKPLNPNNGLDEEALHFLHSTYPKPKALSALEWKVVAEWFGEATQHAFLEKSFGFKEMEAKAIPSVTPEKAPLILWILDPYQRLKLNAAKEKPNSEEAQTQALLKKAGYRVEILEVSPFSRAEEQADELRLELSYRIEQNSLLLFSSGDASAILHKTFDLNPGFLHRKEIIGWINLNGRLFGRKLEETSGARKLASTGIEHFKSDASQELNLLYKEGIERQPALGADFPIINVVSLESGRKPASNLRESLVQDGHTLTARKGNGLHLFGAALNEISQKANTSH